MKDLFGEEVKFDPAGPALTRKERRKLLTGRTTPMPKGHAWKPGTGPAGETCGSCKHYVRKKYNRRIHLKCGLVEAQWTHGPGSDIRAKDPACKKWEAS